MSWRAVPSSGGLYLAMIAPAIMLCGCSAFRQPGASWRAVTLMAVDPVAASCVPATGSGPGGYVSMAESLVVTDADQSELWAQLAEHYYAMGHQAEQSGCTDSVECYYLAALHSSPDHHSNRSVLPTALRMQALHKSSLAKLFETGQAQCRLSVSKGLVVHLPGGTVNVPVAVHEFLWSREEFGAIRVVGDYTSPRLTHAYRRKGIGVPLLVTRAKPVVATEMDGFYGDRLSFAATAVLRAESSGVGRIELYDPLRVESMDVADCQWPLVADFTAPFIHYLEEDAWNPLAEFLRPGRDFPAKLAAIEPYQPGKIPVVFIHGLLSDPLTYVDLANELLANPCFRSRYQIWAFAYPTGEPLLESAAEFREQMSQWVQVCDPHGNDLALRQTVLLGHSMGGLLAKLQVTQSQAILWDAVAHCPFDRIRASNESLVKLAPLFFFEPNPYVSRVVFIATPHNGSPWAGRFVGRTAAKLVSFEDDRKKQYAQLLKQNPGVFRSAMDRGIPTSVDMLERDNPVLRAMQRLPVAPKVQLHNLIGTGRCMLVAGEADGVVPAQSAEHPNVQSELRIPASHTDIQRHPDTVREVQRILALHALNVPRACNLPPDSQSSPQCE